MAMMSAGGRTAMIAGGALALALLGFTLPARVEFAVCNQTFDVVNVAIGQQADGSFRSEGWWTVGANQCANVIREELRSRYIYVYAIDVFGQPLLAGTQSLCVGDKRFVIDSETDCWQRGYRAADFVEVDTQESPRWTVFLRTNEAGTTQITPAIPTTDPAGGTTDSE